MTFEEALEKLKGSVEKLDSGDLTLEEMISVYEDGSKMARRCQEILDEAKGRVLKLQENGGEVTESEME